MLPNVGNTSNRDRTTQKQNVKKIWNDDCGILFEMLHELCT